jgi:hypothetical protein
MLATFLAGVVAIFSTQLALPCALMAHAVLTYMIVVPSFFATVPFASVFVPSFTLFWVCMLYAGIAALLYWFGKRKSESTSVTSEWTIEDEEKAGGSHSEPPASPDQSQVPFIVR